MEGRIPLLLVEEHHIHLQQDRSCRSANSWAAKVSECLLLGITHKQWIYRNAHVHLEKLDDHATAEHEVIMSWVRCLLWTHPDNLLPHDRMLLEGDSEELGSGTAASCLYLYWIASNSMEVALGAATHHHHHRHYQAASIATTTPPSTVRTVGIVPMVDTEGSIKYRQCCHQM